MKVLMVEPGKVPYVTELGEDLKSLQAAVGGHIEAVYPWEDPVALVCNEDGLYLQLPPNRAVCDEDGNVRDLIVGKFFIVGLGEEDFADLPDELSKKFYEMFKCPESFVQTAHGIEVLKQPIQIRKDERVLSDAEPAPVPKHPGLSV